MLVWRHASFAHGFLPLPGVCAGGRAAPARHGDAAALCPVVCARPRTRTFRGRESIAVTLDAPSTTITLHAAEIAFGEVTIEDAGGSQTGDGLAQRQGRDGDAYGAARDCPRPRDDSHHLHRHPQRQAARLLLEQGQRPQVRRQPDGGHRRAPRVSRRSTSRPTRRPSTSR